MSQEIDKRVVEMQFDNKQFEKNVQTSLGTIEKLKIALDFDGSKGLDDLSKAANNLDLSNVSKQIEQVQAKFSALQVVGYTMVQEITKHFISLGKNIWGATFGQIKSGGMSRALKIEQAEFKMRALARNMFDVSLGMDEIDKKVNGLMANMSTAIDNAVTGTAYGYDAAADVASQLMASGIRDADKMENYLKGVAGAAAMTGNSFEQLGHVFTTVASNGKLMTMQLRQFSTYGMNLSASLAKVMNKSEAQINKMVADGQISFEQFADALSELYGGAAQEADNTFAGVTTNIKAQLSRLGQRFAVPFIQNAIPFLQKVKAGIKEISKAIAPMAERFDLAFGYLTKWGTGILERLGYHKIEVAFRAIENVIYGVVLVLHSLYNAFKRVFPKSLTSELYDLSKIFLEFSQNILPTTQALEGLENVFSVLLFPLKLAINSIKNLVKYGAPLLGLLARFVNVIFELFSYMSPLLDAVYGFLNKSGFIEKVAIGFANIITLIAVLLKSLTTTIMLVVYQISQFSALEDVINMFKSFGSILLTVGKYLLMALGAPFALILGVLYKIGSALPDILNLVSKGLDSVKNKIGPFIEAIVYAFKNKDISKIQESFSGFLKDFEVEWRMFDRKYKITKRLDEFKNKLLEIGSVFKKITDVIKERLSTLTASKLIFGAFGVAAVFLVLALIRLSDAFTRFILTVRQVPFLFTRINQTLKSFNKYIAPSMLITSFAIAIGVLALSLDKIASIPAEDLDRASKVITKFGAALMVFAFVMTNASSIVVDANKVSKTLNPGGTILAMAVSMILLAKALKIMSDVVKEVDNIDDVFIDLFGLMGGLALVLTYMAKFTPALSVSALAFTSFAAAVYILTRALIAIAKLKTEVSEDDIGLILTLMVGLGLAVSVAGKAVAGSALAIFAFSTSLLTVLIAIMMFSAIPFDVIKNGIEKAREIFEMFIPLILALGIANKLSSGPNAVNMTGGIGKFVLSLSVFLLGLGLFFKLTEHVDPHQMANATGYLISVLFMITIMVGVLMAIHKHAEMAYRQVLDATKGVTLITKGMGDLAVLLLAMAGTTLILAAVARVLEDVYNPWSIVEAIVLFAVVAAAAVGLCSQVAKMKDVSVKPMLGMIATIIALMGGLALLTFAAKDDPVAVMAAAGAIFVVLAGLALVMRGMKGFQRESRQVNTNVSSALDEILPLMALLGLVAFMMIHVTEILGYADDIMAFDATMGLIMVGMIGISIAAATVIKILNNIKVDQFISGQEGRLWSIFGMFASVIALMGAISASMVLLSKIPTDKLKNVGITMGIIAVSVLAILSIFPFLLKLWKDINGITFMEIGGGIALFSLTLIEIAGALAIMSNMVNPNTLLANAGAIAALLLEVGVIIGILAAINKDSNGTDITRVGYAMLAASGGILAIAAAFSMMSAVGLTPDAVSKYAVAVAILTGVLFAGLAVITLIANRSLLAVPTLQALAMVIGSLGVTALGIGVALVAASEAFKTFSNATESEVNNVVDCLLVFVGRVPDIITGIALAIINSAPAIGLAIGALVSFMISGIAVAVATSASTLLTSLTSILKVVADWAKAEETVMVIHDASYALAVAFIDGFIQGTFDGINDSKVIQDAANKIFETFDLAKPFQDYKAEEFAIGYAETLQRAMYKVQHGEATWEEYGEYIVAGLNNGIEKGYWTYEQAMQELARRGLDGYAEEMLIHSPSRKMEGLGNYTILGLLEAVKNGEMTFEEAMAMMAEGAVDSFSSILTDGNLLKNAGILNGNFKTIDDIRKSGAAWHYDDVTGDYIETWREAGYESLDAYVEAHKDLANSEGFDLLSQILGGFDMDEITKNFDMSGMTDQINDLGEESDEASKRIEKLRDSIMGVLDIFTEFKRETSMTSKDVFKTYLGQIEGVVEWTDMLTELGNRGLRGGILTELEEEGPKSYEKVHAIYSMTNTEIAMLNALYSDAYDLSLNSVDLLEKSVANVNALSLDDFTENTRKAIVSLDNFDDEVKATLTELQSLEQGGNVNLLMRPAIDTEELNKAGWDAGEGFATMFTSTFSGGNDDIAMNFTPIIVDPKTGKYLGVMSPDEFDNYCYDVIDGVRKDTLNLKVGATFTGADAIEKAGEAGQRIHELHEALGEDWGKDGFANFEIVETGETIMSDFEEGINNGAPSVLDTLRNFGKSAIQALRDQLKFEEALEAVKTFRDELSKSISGSMSIFDELEEEEEISAHKMLHNMTQQVKKVGRWATNLSVLASRGMSEGLLNQLKDLGPAGAAKVEAFVKMSAAQLQRANSVFESSSKVGNYAADKLVSSYARAGYQTSLGFSDGIDSEAAERAMYALGEKSLTSLQEALDIHSPSRKTYDLGVNTILGYSEGIKDQAATDELMATIADFGLKIGEAYKEATTDKYLDNKIYLDQGAYEPVIRPLVDMSGVEAGINSFFANRQFSLSGTIGNAMAAQNKGPSVDAIMITTAVKELGSRVDRLNNSVNELRQGQAETRNAIRGIDIRLDTGALVGGIVNQMDSALGSKAVRVKRRKG